MFVSHPLILYLTHSGVQAYSIVQLLHGISSRLGFAVTCRCGVRPRPSIIRPSPSTIHLSPCPSIIHLSSRPSISCSTASRRAWASPSPAAAGSSPVHLSSGPVYLLSIYYTVHLVSIFYPVHLLSIFHPNPSIGCSTASRRAWASPSPAAAGSAPVHLSSGPVHLLSILYTIHLLSIYHPVHLLAAPRHLVAPETCRCGVRHRPCSMRPSITAPIHLSSPPSIYHAPGLRRHLPLRGPRPSSSIYYPCLSIYHPVYLLPPPIYHPYLELATFGEADKCGVAE